MPYKDNITNKEYTKYYNKVYHEVNREYDKNRTKERKLKIREWYNGYKKQFKCKYCNSNEDIHFHHIDPSNKKTEVSRLVHYGYSIDRILEEIEKCIPLCRSCHSKEGYRLGHILVKRSSRNSNPVPCRDRTR